MPRIFSIILMFIIAAVMPTRRAHDAASYAIRYVMTFFARSHAAGALICLMPICRHYITRAMHARALTCFTPLRRCRCMPRYFRALYDFCASSAAARYSPFRCFAICARLVCFLLLCRAMLTLLLLFSFVIMALDVSSPIFAYDYFDAAVMIDADTFRFDTAALYIAAYYAMLFLPLPCLSFLFFSCRAC